MINQEDNMGFNDQIQDALEFLKKNEEQSQMELDYINDSIKCLEAKLQEVNYKISSITASSSNADLFSPTIKNDKDSRYKKLVEEKQNIEKQIKEAEVNFLVCIRSKNSFDNLLNCFNLLTKESDSSLKDNNVYNLDNIHDTNLHLGLKILETQETERKRIARDLHDSTVQNLTNMMHKTELCTRLIDLDHVRAKLELQTMVSTIKSTINDMRNIIYNLRPMSLDDLGLVDTIEKYIKDFKTNHEIEIDLVVMNKEVSVLPVINLTLFRIVQEATNNAIKHGSASKINVNLQYNKETIELCIEDNGIGFKESNIESSNMFTGYGLSMMKERVLLLTGDINIESIKNKGTKIYVNVPIRNHKEGV